MGTAAKSLGVVVPAVGAGRPGFVKRWRLLRLLSAGVGGFNLTGGDAEGVAALAHWIANAARRPLMLAYDLEGGGLFTLDGIPDLPPNMALGAAGDEELAREVGRARGAVARRLGLNTLFAPCLDIASEPANPIVNVRSFGSDPDVVARLGTAMMEGIASQGVLPVVKHFPGHGATRVDSHAALPTVAADAATLRQRELVPFREAVARGAGAVMLAHLLVPALGDETRPATLSPAALRCLRDELGFGGLAITDALMMEALLQTRDERAGVEAFAAGCDVLLMPQHPWALARSLARAVTRGTIPAQRLDAALARLAAALPGAGAPWQEVDAEELAQRVASAAMTLLPPQQRAPTLPLPRSAAPLPLLALVPRGLPRRERLAAALATHGIPATPIVADSSASDPGVRAALDRAATGPLIVSLYFSPLPGGRGIELDADLAAALEATAQRRPIIAIAFGSPWVLECIPSAAIRLCAWGDAQACQQAAAAVLAGTAPAPGRLPVPLAT